MKINTFTIDPERLKQIEQAVGFEVNNNRDMDYAIELLLGAVMPKTPKCTVAEKDALMETERNAGMIGFLLKIKDLFDFGRKVFCPCCQCEFRAKRKNSYLIPTWEGYKLTHDCPCCGASIVYGKVRNEKNGR